MHDTALEIGKLFFEKYITKANPSVLDVGAYSVNGSLRTVAPSNSTYIGIDIEKGEGVDLVLSDPYSFPFSDNHFDAIVCTSVFEHDSFFWQTFLEMLRVVNDGGFIYINTPSNGLYHAYPQDCWRFYPDSALSLKNWAEKNGGSLTLIESFIGKRKNDQWNDCVMVFRKGIHPHCEYKFIHTDFQSYNARRIGLDTLINKVNDTEDQLILQAFQRDLHSQINQTNEQDLRRHNAEQGIEALRQILEAEKKQYQEERRGMLAHFKDESAELQKRHEEREKQLEISAQSTKQQLEHQLQQQASFYLAHQKLDAELALAYLQEHRNQLDGMDRRIREQVCKQADLKSQALTQERRKCEHLYLIADGNKRKAAREKRLSEERNQQDSFAKEKQRTESEVSGRLLELQRQKGQLERQIKTLDFQNKQAGEEIAHLKNELDSAVQWQRRSWAKRAFHTWRRHPLVSRILNGTGDDSIDGFESKDILSLNDTTFPSTVFGEHSHQDDEFQIQESDYHPLFDANWYLNTYPDVEEERLDPYAHYLEIGWKEGRNPNPIFNTSWYLKTYPDVAEAGLDPFQHYLNSGWKEGRNPSPFFDVNWYLKSYSDVAEVAVEPLQHFIDKGWIERRKPSPLFDTDWYLTTYPHVAELNHNPLQYYIEGGFSEGNFPNPLFDSAWYLDAYSDIKEAGVNPLQHFIENGWKEGRNPNPLFDTNWYLESNRDVKLLKINPLVHFLEHGWKEGRKPNPLFDTRYYLGNYLDVADAQLNPLAHYIHSGAKEERNPHPLFYTQWYLESYPEVALSQCNPLQHYLEVGCKHGYKPNPLFDSKWYLSTYEDIRESGINPLWHFFHSGWKEGRNPNPLFDTAWYLNNYSDVKEAGINPLQHFLECGWKEGRNPNAIFDTRWYLNQYQDVKKANLNPLQHYLEDGAEEGRDPGPNFDSKWYLETHLDVKKASINPLEHYLLYGYQEGRDSRPPLGKTPTSPRAAVRTNVEFIEATFAAYPSIDEAPAGSQVSICFLGHSLIRTGAPVILQNIVKKMSHFKEVKCYQIINDVTDRSHLDSSFGDEVRAIAPTVTLAKLPYCDKDFILQSVLEWFEKLPNPKLVFANTVTTWEFAELFHKAGIRVFTFVHERPEVISQLMTKDQMSCLVRSSEYLMVSNEDNARRVSSLLDIPIEKISLVPYGSDEGRSTDSAKLRQSLLDQFSIPLDADLILGAGSIELRKSPELFTQAALLTLRKCDELGARKPYFVWFGGVLDTEVLRWSKYDLKHSDADRYVHFGGEITNLPDYYSITKLFLLTSREESFSLVGLDALSNGVPVIAFEGATGLEVACPGSLITVPYLDTSKMADKVVELLTNDLQYKQASEQASIHTQLFTWDKAAEAVRKLVLGNATNNRLSIVLLSHGPPPLRGLKVEGGGLRSWGLAKTLKSLLPEADVILHYGISAPHVPPEFTEFGVKIICCEQDQLMSLLNSVDVIIVSYCGYLTNLVLDRISPRQLLILDCYVPIYVEVAARDSKDVNFEYDQYIQQVPMWNRALLRGDYFLYANENQRDFYTGVLSSLSVINPKTYKKTPLLHIPYGIDEDEPQSIKRPVTNALYNKNAKRILWFGGVYPWFDLRTLIDAVAIISKSIAVELIVVGARNPFNTHPDFVRSASETIAYGSTPELSKIVHFEDWVDFNDRASWYLDCDIIVSLSKMGIENRYSWRTRTVDFIWSGALLALNEGDPVADRLFAADAAVKLTSLESAGLAKILLEVLENPTRAAAIKSNLVSMRKEFTWPTLVAPLATTLRERFPSSHLSH